MRWWWLPILVGCGRVDFDQRAIDAPQVDGASSDGASEPGLIAHYKLDGDPTAGVEDATGLGPPGTCTSCPVQVAGRIGGAYQFDGTANLVQFEALPYLSTTQGFTVSAWVRPSTLAASTSCVVGKAYGTMTDNSWQICTHLQNLRVCFGGLCGTPTSNVLAVGTWTHAAITWDGTTARVWADAIEQFSTSVQVAFDSGPILLGADLDGGTFLAPFAGDVDDVRIYNYALTPAELAALP